MFPPTPRLLTPIVGEVYAIRPDRQRCVEFMAAMRAIAARIFLSSLE
jgi:hypothetical protein